VKTTVVPNEQERVIRERNAKGPMRSMYYICIMQALVSIVR
jgi:hypothetical protein